MVCFEGFILSHTSMPVKIPNQEEIDDFLPPYNPAWVMDVENPITHSSLVFPEWYMEFRCKIQEAMENAKRLIPLIDQEYGKRFGSSYGGLMERYQCEDADVVLLSMGTIGSEARIAVDNLRRQGYKVGSARLRVFRPFPKEEVRRLSEGVQVLAVIDRHVSFGFEGQLFTEVKASLYGESDSPKVIGFVAGLGGRDVTYEDIERIGVKCHRLLKGEKIMRETEWVNLRA
jgi:pyruvate/2-oxoacid:ferredoxin oxidoreductase alpha subunit